MEVRSDTDLKILASKWKDIRKIPRWQREEGLDWRLYPDGRPVGAEISGTKKSLKLKQREK